MWNQVGSPSMFEGNTFLPLHGMPMWCSARSSTRLADWLPEPFTVPTRIARSLTDAGADGAPSRTGAVSTAERVVAITRCASVGSSDVGRQGLHRRAGGARPHRPGGA